MKIIEGMKRIKMNDEKVADLQAKIAQNSAALTIETPLYEDAKAKVREWLQSCQDLSQESVRLLIAIQRTNLATQVTIELGGKQVTKSIAEWVWRRRKFAAVDLTTFSKLTDRHLKEGFSAGPTGGQIEMKIVRNYDPADRDKIMAMYREEPSKIDSTLEVVNATTDLLEA